MRLPSQKLESMGNLLETSAWSCLPSFRYHTSVWWTDGRTDVRRCHSALCIACM